MEIALLLALGVAEAVAIGAALRHGGRLVRFVGWILLGLLTAGVMAAALSFIIFWTDTALYERGIRLNADYMVFLAPAVTLIASVAMGAMVAWKGWKHG